MHPTTKRRMRDERQKGESVSNPDNNEEVLEECATIGAAVLAAQRVEFLLYGLISHVKPELKRGGKRFEDLTPESFLRADPSNLRATLGQLTKAYGPKFLLSADDLAVFVKNRNLIAHDYWRLTKARIQDGRALENPMPFLQEFLNDCSRWERILQGLLAIMRLSIARRTGGEQQLALTQEDLDYMDQYSQHVQSHLVHKE